MNLPHLENMLRISMNVKGNAFQDSILAMESAARGTLFAWETVLNQRKLNHALQGKL